MSSFRVTLSHYIKEEIILDVQAPDHETVKERLGDIHAVACEVPTWSIDTEAQPTHIDIAVEPSENYDNNPDATLRVEPDGTVGLVEVLGDQDPLTGKATEEKKARIERALYSVESCCLDNENDFRRVVAALMEAV